MLGKIAVTVTEIGVQHITLDETVKPEQYVKCVVCILKVIDSFNCIFSLDFRYIIPFTIHIFTG